MELEKKNLKEDLEKLQKKIEKQGKEIQDLRNINLAEPSLSDQQLKESIIVDDPKLKNLSDIFEEVEKVQEDKPVNIF